MDEIYIKESPDGFQLNKFDVKRGELEAVVTSFKNYDKVNDVIETGALDNFLKEFDGGLPMLYQHTKNEIVGTWTKLYIDGDNVVGKGQIFPEVSRGSDSIALISRGMIGATSIGFTSTDFERNDEGGLNFKEIALTEISLVRSPANPKAQILSAKDEDGAIDIRKVEKLLRDAGLSRKESLALISDGKSALRDVVDIEDQKMDIVANALKLLN